MGDFEEKMKDSKVLKDLVKPMKEYMPSPSKVGGYLPHESTLDLYAGFRFKLHDNQIIGRIQGTLTVKYTEKTEAGSANRGTPRFEAKLIGISEIKNENVLVFNRGTIDDHEGDIPDLGSKINEVFEAFYIAMGGPLNNVGNGMFRMYLL